MKLEDDSDIRKIEFGCYFKSVVYSTLKIRNNFLNVQKEMKLSNLYVNNSSMKF